MNRVTKHASTAAYLVRHVLPFVGLVFLFGAVAVVSPTFTKNSDAAVGAGGDEEGGSGGAQTSNGWGWYRYRLGGDKAPASFRDGTPWNDVVNKCVSEGANQVIAFIVLTRNESDGNHGVVYRYKSGWMDPLLSNYQGGKGGNWLTLSGAKSLYDMVDDDDKEGFYWGTNVAWFCHTEGTYTLSTDSYVTTDTADWGDAGRDITVHPGTTAYYKHTVKNVGALAAVFKTRHDVYESVDWAIGDWSRHNTLAANTTWTPLTSRISIPSSAADNAKYCERYNVNRTSPSNQANIQSDSACAIVKYVWALTPAASITSGAEVNRPGQTLTWQHKITNNGPDSVIKDITYSGENQGEGALGTGQVDSWNVRPRIGMGGTRQQNTTHAITQDDVGKTLCRRTAAAPKSSTDTNTIHSGNACRDIPYNYSLTPTIELSRDEGQPGSEFSVKGSVGSTNITKSKETEWRYSYVIVAPSRNEPGGSTSTPAEPCSQYTGTGVTCSVASFGSGGAGSGTGLVIPETGYTFDLRYSTIQDLAVGTKVCYGLSVKDRASDSTEWRHSTLDCMVVSKRPLVRIMGGDLLAGRSAPLGGVSTNTKIIGAHAYGSYAEYGVISSGLVRNMGSADGFAGGPSLSAALVPCNVGNLSLSNRPAGGGACSTGNVGFYNFGGVTPAIASRFPISNATPAVPSTANLTALPSRAVYRGPGALGSDSTIYVSAAGGVPVGSWYVLNAPTSTVVITDNITYRNDPISSLSAIPQVVIIARNIIVKDSVSQVDAWLVATGTGNEGKVHTCGTGTSGTTEMTRPNALQCSGALRVNGPVMANHLILARTAGAGTGPASGEPAELFNLRPDAYMWASAVQNDTAKARTVLVTELPPRF